MSRVNVKNFFIYCGRRGIKKREKYGNILDKVYLIGYIGIILKKKGETE